MLGLYAYWNGSIIPIEDVKISPLDRGYQFGDGVYEVIRFYAGQLFETGRHLKRLQRSLNELFIPAPINMDELEKTMHELIQQENLAQSDGMIYLQITRGAYPRSHSFPKGPAAPNMIMYAQTYPRPDIIEAGAKVTLHPDLRWHRVDIKTLNLLGNVLAKQKAEEKGYHEAILHRADVVTEASTANVFIVRKGVIWTHPANEAILNGITRLVVIDLIHSLGIPFVERPFTVDALLTADEVFLTSTTLEVTPVTMIDDLILGEGIPGPLSRKLQEAFTRHIQAHSTSETRRASEETHI
ncbi:MAG: D-amino-acid transaminase [Candidatus Carbobacillus altaicus]|nr:D-amino-acid transaminase [Candidatus Carbobacillus altaicus]